jgi:hypothetical protein
VEETGSAGTLAAGVPGRRSPVKTERTSSRVISFVSAMGPIYAWIEQRSSYGWPAAT